MSGFDWASVLPFILTISVALTVVVGVIGLRQGHYYKGRITKRGRRAVAVMTALGVVTLASAFVGQRISDAKEQQDADTRSRQFATQMSSLKTTQDSLNDSIRRQERLTENLRSVQQTLDESLVRQERLVQASAENLRMGRTLQAQSERNAARIVSRVADEANRLTLQDVFLAVNFADCQGPDGPMEFGRPSVSWVYVEVEGPTGSVSLTSDQPAPISVALFRAATFHDFRGSVVGFETLAPWRRANIRVTAYVDDLPLFDRRERSVLNMPRTRPLDRPPPSCNVTVVLSAKGRWLFSATARMEQYAERYYRLRASVIRDRRRRFSYDVLFNE